MPDDNRTSSRESHLNFEEIYEIVRRLAESYRLGDQTDDIVQECFATCLAKYGRLEGRQLLLLIRQVLRMKALSLVRDQRRESKRLLSYHALGPEVVDNIEDESAWASPEESAQASELATIIERAVVKLNAEQRELIDLLISGYKPKEVAQRLGITVKALANRVYRLRRKLRAELKRMGYEI